MIDADRRQQREIGAIAEDLGDRAVAAARLPLDGDQAWVRFITRVGALEDDAHTALIDEHYGRYAAGTRGWPVMKLF
ncbi:hypothetical protein [Burkholderia sp. BCC1977]|uniref:hypothetical protein n=1 Tax=Burkholderia sp. BCC1977 TaxID=2817440 RepID=UPI002ABD7598|nr:hypothetical protein [Burkholderia sp. BCC1977]